MQITQILNEIKAIKTKPSKNQGFCNYYNKYNGLTIDLPAWIGSNTVLFIVPEEYINRLFFYTKDWDEMEDMLQEVPDGCVIDYVCKEIPAELESILMNSGFTNHAVYARRTLPVPFDTTKGDAKYKALMKKLYKPDLGAPATEEDFPALKELMFDTFDPINSDIPTSEELLEDIRNKTVWIHKEKGVIVTLYIFRIFGQKRYGAMTYNKLSADYLSSLVTNAHKESEKTHPVKWHYGWINISNKQIIRTLEKEGVLELDGIKNYIFQKQEVN